MSEKARRTITTCDLRPSHGEIYDFVRGGGGGIRTHGTPKGQGLANLCHWPLGDTSKDSSDYMDF